MTASPRRALGMRSRLILLLLGALVAAQLATLALLLVERGRAVRFATAEEIAARTLALAQELDARAPAARGSALRPERSHRLRFWISADPVVGRAERRRLPRLEARVADSADASARDLRIALLDRDRFGPEDPRRDGHWHRRDQLVVSVALADGGWLNARAAFRVPPPQWAWPALTSFALAAMAVAAVVWFSLGRILRPIGAVATAADRLGWGEKPEPLPLRGPRETQRLADAFNRMADRLTRLLDERARTLAAIGHDLRSPVTAMRLRVEMVDDDETRERLTLCLDEIQALVEAALALARGTGADEPPQRVDLGALLQAVVGDLQATGGRASLEVSEPVIVEARPAALKRALRNIAENAVRYGGEARIAYRRDDLNATVDIDDAGPGIAPEDRDRVFEPFVRLETSRSRETGGAGLGLAIARAAIEAHGGTIGLETAPGGGTRAIVTLPLSCPQH